MAWLIAGLIVFLGAHSVRIFADDWRRRQIAQRGEARWKGLFSIVSALGLGLIIWGYGAARAEPVLLWSLGTGGRHAASLFTLLAFVLISAAYVPATHMRARLGHPMLAGVKLWAFAHLLANGTLADLLLFGSFLVWAIVDFAASRRRDRAQDTSRPASGISRDLIALATGVVAWAVFALWLHGPLIGVRPFG